MPTSAATDPNCPEDAATESADVHAAAAPPTEAELLSAILAQLQVQTGHDFSHYKSSTMLRRINRRMTVAEIGTLPAYLAQLQADPLEAPALLRECLIAVTDFFRDPEAFAALGRTIIPQILRSKNTDEPVRGWIVGCATGEEAYSVAMLLSEAAADLGIPSPIQVFATDIDEAHLAFARRGLYPSTIAEQVSAERLQRFFIAEKDGYRVKAELREKVLFAVHNLLRDPPFSNLDLLCCRNVLIYFEREAQEKSFELFHYALHPEGYLFLGTSESAESASTLFVPLDHNAVDKRHHLYQRRPSGSQLRRLPALAPSRGVKVESATMQPPAPASRTVQEIYEAWTLRRYAPPRLLVNEEYDVVQIFNGAGRYLVAPDGLVTQHILHKIIPALRLDLRAALYQAFTKGERSESRLLQVTVNGEPCLIQLYVGPVHEPDFPKELIEVVFEERKEDLVIGAASAAITPTMAENELVTRLEEELQRTREQMQMILEEHENSLQEARAANEELQSINEELKSTGEELETSKEELQSMNEEMTTVNSELKLKIEELSRANSDLFNLMASTNVGAIFLDPLLQVKRFTPRATELFYLIESDIGRPFAHIAHRIRSGATGTRPLELANQVRTTQEQVEEVVQGDNERWYILRLFPYRTLDNLIDGVVITFIDITDWQRAEHELQQRRQQQLVADLGRQALQGATPAELIESAAAQLSALLAVDFAAVFATQGSGDLLLQAGVGWQPGYVAQSTANVDRNFPIWYAWRAGQPVMLGAAIDGVAGHLVAAVATGNHFDHSPLLTEHGIVSGVSVPIGGGSQPYGVLGVYRRTAHHFTQYAVDFLQAVANLLAETIQRKAAEAQLHFQAHLLGAVEQAVIATDLNGQITYWNRFAESLYGWPAAEAVGRNILEVTPTTTSQEQAAALLVELQQGRSWSGEFQVQRRAGPPFLALVTDSPIYDTSGRLCGIVGVSQDITARKAAEDALRASEERLRLGTAVAELAIAEVDYTTDLITLNPRAATLFGLPSTVGSVPRTTIHALFHLDDATELWRRINEALDPTGPGWFAMEHRIMRPDGQLRWLNVRKQIFFAPDRDGVLRPQRALLAMLDIQERKLAEAALRESETRLNTILQNIPASIYMLTPDQRYLYVNRYYEQLAQVTNAEIQGKAIDDMFDPETAAALAANDHHTLAAKMPIELEEYAPHEGEMRTYWSVKVPLLNEQGEPYALIGISTEITARKRAERNQQFLFDLDAQTRLLDDAQTILTVTAAQLGQYLCLAHCTFNEIDLDADQGVVLAHWRHNDELPIMTGTHQLSTTLGPALTATLRRGHNVVVEHVLQDQRTAWLADRHTAIGVQSLVRIPYQLKGARLALLAVADDHPRTWRDDEVTLLETVIARIWPLILKARAEAALRRQEEMLHQIADNVPGQIAYIGADERYRFVNATFESWFQRPRQHFIGNTLGNLLGEEERARFGRYRQQVLAGETVSYETDFTYPDGVTRAIWGRYQPDRAADGTVAGFYLFIMDISERKQAEAEQRASEMQARRQLAEIESIYATAPVGLAVLDKELRYLRINKHLAEINGVAADKHIGRTIRNVVPMLADVAEQQFRHVIETGQPLVDLEVVGETRAQPGFQRTWLENVYPLYDGLGELVAITVVVQEITERKWAEEALRASAERFRTLANAMPQLVWTADSEGNVDYYNVRIADYEPTVRLAEGGFDWPRLVHPDDLAPTFVAWRAAAARGAPYTFEHRLRMADASWRWHLSLAMPTTQADNQLKWYGTATDIHERKKMEEALYASEAQLNAILYNMPASVYMLTTDHRYLLVNRIYEQENRITHAEIRGQSIYDRWPTAVAEVLAANERQVVATKSPIEVEEAVLRGEEMHYYATIKAPLLDAAGEPYAIIGISTDITERKRAEAALRQSEARYRTLFETMDEGFCIFEMLFDEQHKPIDYRFLEVNPAFAHFTGLENAIGKTARELVPNLEPYWFETYGNVALTGEPLRFVQGSAAMGRWFEAYAFRFGGPESRQVALLFTDVTERKQVEDQLRSQEELLRQIADNVPGLIGYIGADERYRFVNAAFESWFQRPRQQIIGSTAFELIGADEHARLSGYRQQALTGEVVSYETDFVYPDGVTRSVWGRYEPHLAADGTVLGFYIFVMDISERKQAEVALLESEKRFRAFFELAAVGAAQVDFKTKRFTTVNDKFCSLTGYTRAELTQLSFQDLTHPADRDHDAEMLAQREAGVGEEYRVEKRYLRKDGAAVWVDLAASVIRNNAGQARYSIAVVVDITERKAAEQALLQFNEQLEQQVKARTAELTKRLQELDQFAYVASHDLRAPLRAIDHLAQWVRDDAADLLPPKSLEHLEKMRGRIMRMEALLNDLLAYSRADRYQYNLVQVDVALLLDDIVRLVTPSQGFAVSIPPGLPVLITCKAPLETVLRNLIHNAIKHHDRSDGQVQVSVQDLGDFYEFSVTDDGPGIVPEFHERIFQIFQTLKPRDQMEGSGMGLAIVKKAVEHYGGRVRVESDGQHGATFAFTWPKEMQST